MKIQKALYDAYLKGTKEVAPIDITVPDNTTLYVPRGVIYGDGANNNVVYVSSKNSFQWGNMPLTSAKVAYGGISNGVQQITLDITRDKRDPETCVYVYFHVSGGESYGCLYKIVNESSNLTYMGEKFE